MNAADILCVAIDVMDVGDAARRAVKYAVMMMIVAAKAVKATTYDATTMTTTAVPNIAVK